MFSEKNIRISFFCFLCSCVVNFPGYWSFQKNCFVLDQSILRFRSEILCLFIWMFLGYFTGLTFIEIVILDTLPTPVAYFYISLIIAIGGSAIFSFFIFLKKDLIVHAHNRLQEIDKNLRGKLIWCNLRYADQDSKYGKELLQFFFSSLMCSICLSINFLIENEYDPAFRYGFRPFKFIFEPYYGNHISTQTLKYCCAILYFQIVGVAFMNFGLVFGISYGALSFEEYWLKQMAKKTWIFGQMQNYVQVFRIIQTVHTWVVHYYRIIYALLHLGMLTGGVIFFGCSISFLSTKSNFKYPEMAFFPFVISFATNIEYKVWKITLSILSLTEEIKGLEYFQRNERTIIISRSFPLFQMRIGNIFIIDKDFGTTTISFIVDQSVSIFLAIKES